MAFPTSINNDIVHELIQATMSAANLDEGNARKVVTTLVNHLSNREVLRVDPSLTVDSRALGGSSDNDIAKKLGGSSDNDIAKKLGGSSDNDIAKSR